MHRTLATTSGSQAGIRTIVALFVAGPGAARAELPKENPR